MSWNTTLSFETPPLDIIKTGDRFAAIDGAGYLYRFDGGGAPTGKRQIGEAKNALAARFLPNGELFLIKENAAIALSLKTGETLSKRTLSVKEIVCAAFSFDRYAVIDADGFLQVFSIDDTSRYSLCPLLVKRPSALFFSADGRFIFAAEREGRAIAYDLALHRVALETKTPKPVIGGSFLPNGRLLLFGRERDLFVISRYANGAALDSLSLPRAAKETLAPTSRYALLGLETGLIAAIDITHNRVARSWKALNEPIAALRVRGDRVFALGEQGAVESFDLAKLNESCALAVASEDCEAANALLAVSGFCLLNEPFCDWMERVWEESVYPSAARFLEEGKPALAKEAVLPFWDDLPKRARFEEEALLANELSQLRALFKNRRMRETQALLSAYPILSESLSGRLFFDEWQNSVETAIEFIKEGEKDRAVKVLSPFINALEKGETARRIIDFPAPFLKAMEFIKAQDWQGFNDLCEREPICKGLPHFEAKERRIAALEREFIFLSDQHAYAPALDAAKALSELGAPPVLKEPIGALLAFTQADQKGKRNSQLALAVKYPFLTDAPRFSALFEESKARLDRAWKAALEGDSQAAYLLTLDEASNPLYLDYAALIMRLAFTEEIRRVTVAGAVNWEESAANYERYFGRDPLLKLAFEAQGKLDALKKTPAPPTIRGYEHFDLPQSILSFVDLGPKEPNRAFSTLTRLGLSAAALIVAAFAFWLLVSNRF
ncbi:MAG: PQQ-like beta-propeller repeat protein [Helicobacteraceae bacterium]|nr:PQQ-like beta-propeller repeat protein [Helicobacteraceae bacterium]